jgi:hypothetical protein
MRHKLILEVSGNEPATKFARTIPPMKSLLTKVAASEGPPVQPQVLRPGPNEFSDHCDIAGGFGGFNRF